MGGQKNNAFSNATAGSSGDGSGGYGVSQTNGKNQSVPQIDPSKALAYYAQAGQTESAGIAAGNTAYQAALQQAASTMQQGYSEANATLAPLSTASNQALTLFQQMMGITPASPTANFGSNLTQIDPQLSATADLINQANSATDPTQRAALQAQINQQVNDAGTGGVTAAQAAISALGSQWTMQNPGPGLTYEPATGWTTEHIGGEKIVSAPQAADDWGTGSLAANQAAWTTANTANQTALTNAQLQQQQLGQFSTQFNNTYNPAAPPQAFTGQQVADHVMSTPGYQFNLDQGSNQIMRNQAAVGNLGTGNTQVALQNYGENYALNSYNSYMGNLQNLINTGVPATQQTAVNQANQGGYLANLQQLGGSANNAASTAEGAAVGAAQTQEGATAYNAAALNTQLQQQTFMMNSGQAAASSAGAMNLASGAQQSSNNNASGAGYYQGMNNVVANSQQYEGNGSYTPPASNNGAI